MPIVQSISEKESQANFVYVMPDYHNPRLGHPVFLEITPAPDIKYKMVPSTSKGMNVLGIVIFSATMGKEITKLKPIKEKEETVFEINVFDGFHLMVGLNPRFFFPDVFRMFVNFHHFSAPCNPLCNTPFLQYNTYTT